MYLTWVPNLEATKSRRACGNRKGAEPPPRSGVWATRGSGLRSAGPPRCSASRDRNESASPSATWRSGSDGSRAKAKGACDACRPSSCRQSAASSAAGKEAPSKPPDGCVPPLAIEARRVVKEPRRPLDADATAEARSIAWAAAAWSLAAAVDHSKMPAPPPPTSKAAGSREKASAVTSRRPKDDGMAWPRRQTATQARAPLSAASSYASSTSSPLPFAFGSPPSHE